MKTPDRDAARHLFEYFRKRRDGIRNSPEMASICLICGSVRIVPKAGDDLMLTCFNCDFAFYRYDCGACGLTIDGRDPRNPGCPLCGQRICTCGACGCPAAEGQ